MVFQTVSAVIAQLVVVIAGTAITAVMLFIAAGAASFAAVVAVFAFPVVIAPGAAVIAFNAVFILGVSRHRNAGKNSLNSLFADGKKINMLTVRGMSLVIFMSATCFVIMTVMTVKFLMYAVLIFRIKVEMLKSRHIGR